MLGSGLFLLNSKKAQNAILEFQSSDWYMFYLPDNLLSKDDFCSAAMEILPLDPPYTAENGHNWDALDDSLWGGLFNFSSEKIVIVWQSAGKMKNNDINCFEIVCDIFSNLITSLSA